LPRKGNAAFGDQTIFQISGKSHEAVLAAIKDLKEYSLDVYTEKVLDSDFYRKTVAQLSDQQVLLIFSCPPYTLCV